MVSDMPTAILENGLRVANFSSPHPFNFDDGTELDRCHQDRVDGFMLDADEQKYEREGWTDIDLQFNLSEECREALEAAIERAESDDIDVIIVPLPVLKAAEADGFDIESTPLRTVRMKNRETKTIYSDRFCL